MAAYRTVKRNAETARFVLRRVCRKANIAYHRVRARAPIARLLNLKIYSLCNFKERIKEIKGGEEDDLGKY